MRTESLKAYRHITSTPKRYGRAEDAADSPGIVYHRSASLLANVRECHAQSGSRKRAFLLLRSEDTAILEKTVVLCARHCRGRADGAARG